jgi:putative phosphoserine phosphatase/1-acylglycerol-3-phosphate O-acyltransferase
LNKIAFFDVDHTLTRHATASYFLRESVHQGLFRKRILFAIPFYMLLYRFGPAHHTSQDHVPKEFSALKGIPQELLLELANDTFEKFIRNDIYPKAYGLISEVREKGYQVYLATSSFDFLVMPLAKQVGVEGVIASKLELEDGQTTGRILGTASFGSGKRDQCRVLADEHKVPFSECAFFSDSIHDLPLLDEVGWPVAVNPDFRLSKIAKKRGWDIRRLKHES